MQAVQFIAKRGSESCNIHLQVGAFSCGRHPRADFRLPNSWSIVSGIHLQINISDTGHVFVRDGINGKESTNGTMVNGMPIGCDRWTELDPDDRIIIGTNPIESVTIQGIWQTANDQTVLDRRTETSENNSTILIESFLHQNDHRASVIEGPSSWECKSTLMIGRDKDNDIQLFGRTVSRRHAIIKRKGTGYLVIDTSSNGTYLNGRPIGETARIRDGDELKISTQTFIWKAPNLYLSSLDNSYRIDIRRLCLKGRLNDISFSIEPGSLVAFVGGSGAGKSSLLTTIIGRNMGYSGQILVNNREIKQCHRMIKQEIGYVPQDDIMHSNLSVEEVLLYTARIKLPGVEYYNEMVDSTLGLLDMAHRRKSRISELSGGQRKRVSIGIELIADPPMLFLDEPTSGLDPGLDKKMMELLKKIADSGKTVVVVTHATANVALCDQVIFLGRGGNLCYSGSPGKCLEYFNVDHDFTEIYEKLDKSDSEIKLISQSFAAYGSRQLKSLENGVRSLQRNSQIRQPYFSLVIGNLKKKSYQFWPVFQREILLIFRDKLSLFMNCITAPLAVLLMYWCAGNSSVFTADASLSDGGKNYTDALKLIQTIVLSGAWVGLSSQLQSLVKERQIFEREKSFNLSSEIYVISKLAGMSLLVLVQSLFLSLVVTHLYKLGPDSLGNWFVVLLISLFMTILSMASQGIFVSSMVNSGQQASSAAPLLLIPQLLFTGLAITLSGDSERIYDFVASRWGMRSIGSAAAVSSLIPEPLKDQFESAFEVYKSSWDNFNGSLLILGIQAVAFMILTYVSIKMRSILKSR